MKHLALILLVVVVVFLVTTMTGCGTIGGTLSGMGSDMKIAGEWCSDLGR